MVTDTAIATGGDERGGVREVKGAGAGIDTDMQVVAGPVPGVDVGIETAIEVLICCRASASIWPSC
jgi:hypothetical protein